jgi:hypothetical protein
MSFISRSRSDFEQGGAMMYSLSMRVFFGACIAATVARASAADVYVICSTGVSVSAADVRGMYLGEKQFAAGVKLQLADNASLQSAFLAKVLSMDTAKYTAVWTKKSFRDGANPPVVKNTDTEVLDFVKRTPGACGYIASPPPADATLAGKF